MKTKTQVGHSELTDQSLAQIFYEKILDSYIYQTQVPRNRARVSLLLIKRFCVYLSVNNC